MKILLLNPPAPDNRAFIREGRCTQEQGAWTTLWPPVTLATAGAMLEADGHEVEIRDCAAQKIPLSPLLEKIRQRPYELVAWSSATPSINADLALADKVKEVNPHIKTVTFGTHVTTLPEACLKESKGLDFVIRNEPEESLAALAAGLANGIGVESIKGLSYRDTGGQVLHNPSRPFIKNLDSIPFPAWHLLDLKKYRLPLIGKKFLILAPIRGCSYPCTFCTAQAYYGRRPRKKTIPRVMDEMEYAMDRFGIDQFFIWADTFTADKEYVIDFCQAIRGRGLEVNWTCNSRVDTINKELLEEMAKSGCWMISYGIESGSQAVLDRVKKNITPGQARNAVRMAKEAGIKVAGHFIFGLPGETEETIKETINFALGLDMVMGQFYCAAPFPGSHLYELATAEGWLEGREFEEFRQDNAVMNLPGLPVEVVNEHRKEAFRRFYLRPKCFFQILGLISSGRIGKTIKEGVRFFGWARS